MPTNMQIARVKADRFMMNFNFNPEFTKILLKFIKKIKIKRLFPDKFVYSNEIYLDLILLRFGGLKNWAMLSLFPNTPHYTNVNRKFNFWCRHGVFDKAYYSFITKHYLPTILRTNNFPIIQEKNNPYFDKTNKLVETNDLDILDLHIDGTYIFNINGTSCKTNEKRTCSLVPEYMKKNGIKLTIVTTADDKIPLVVLPSRATVHDTKLIKPSLDLIKEKYPELSDSKYLIGDKGYASTPKNRKSFKNLNNTILITPVKKSEKKRLKNTKFEKLRLRFRRRVEHSISFMKNNCDTRMFTCRHLHAFMGFIFIKLLSLRIKLKGPCYYLC